MKVVQVLRKSPQQERARRRVAHVLDTADSLLAAEGADALTTTRVAEAAGISVGSLYQYFPDRDAIAEALALRYAEDFAHLLDDLDGGADAVIDAFAQAFRAAPGFRAMWFGGLRTQRLRDVTRPALDRIADTLAERWDVAPDVAVVGVTAADALLRHAFRVDPQGDPQTLSETKLLLTAYLERRT